MAGPDERSVRQVIRCFRIDGELQSVEPWGSGHIHDTYAGRFRTAGGEVRFIHQRINDDVFPRPVEVMENIERVTGHLREKVLAEGGDPERGCLQLVPAQDGGTCHRDGAGAFWRTYRFIEGAQTYNVVQRPEQVYQAARAFGRFQRRLRDLPGPPLHETIPRFGDSLRRFEAFLEALDADSRDRAVGAGREIDAVLEREELASRLGELQAQGGIPSRIIHYDTKLNNVLLDDETGEGICVIDLDTVMAGTALYDFGDMARLGAAGVREDEPDLSRVGVDLDLFEPMARGYLEVAREFLTTGEIDHLALSVKLITFTMAVRFLTDYLAGDPYFKTRRESHNLDRCRTHLALVRDMESKEAEMEAVIGRHR
jgi:Ser/Thr protein kinase RdoA (MazF antagonist)